jgi:hypothetical protein
VEHGQHTVSALVICEGNVTIGIEFEAMTLGVVANVICHVTVSAHS